jgi:hypothetical protein
MRTHRRQIVSSNRRIVSLNAVSAIWLNRSTESRPACLSAHAEIKAAGRGILPIGSVRMSTMPPGCMVEQVDQPGGERLIE